MTEEKQRDAMSIGSHSKHGGISKWGTALWFGAFGLSVALVMYGIPAWRRGLVEIGLYILSPALATTIAGYVLGPTIVDPYRTPTLIRAATKGALVSLVALALHSVLFAALYALTHQNHEVNLPGLMFATLSVGAMAVGPVILVAGIACAVILNYRARRLL